MKYFTAPLDSPQKVGMLWEVMSGLARPVAPTNKEQFKQKEIKSHEH